MNEESALRAAIIAYPDEDAPRTIYADWLTDQGRAGEAEFIRVQCKPNPSIAELSYAQYRMDYIERKIVEAHQGILFLGFNRGFVDQIVCTAESWLAYADMLYWHPSESRDCPATAQPLRKVALTTRPESLEPSLFESRTNRGVIRRVIAGMAIELRDEETHVYRFRDGRAITVSLDVPLLFLTKRFPGLEITMSETAHNDEIYQRATEGYMRVRHETEDALTRRPTN